jgi:predicted HicB family RNase H-like nuclease
VPEPQEPTAEERERYEEYMAALMLSLDEQDARIESEWESEFAAMQEDAKGTRKQLRKAVKDNADGIEEGDDSAYLALQVAAGAAIWDWQARAAARMGLRLAPTRGMPPLGEPVPGTVEVNNRRWEIGGDAVTTVQRARAETADALEEAGKVVRDEAPEVAEIGRAVKRTPLEHQGEPLAGPLGKRSGKIAGTVSADVAALAAELAAQHGGTVESWVENIIRNLDYYSHQALNPFVDAMVAGGLVSAVEAMGEAAEGFDPPENALRLSHQTHTRAAVRSTLAKAGEAMESDAYLYYAPQGARATVTESSFATEHAYHIRTATEWEGVRTGLDAKRPGSFIFSTGFHPGDRGFLIPIPAALVGAAYAVERRRRQKFLEKQQARQEEE